MSEARYFEQFRGDIDEPWIVTRDTLFIQKYCGSYAEAEELKLRLERRFPDHKFGMMPAANGIPASLRLFPIEDTRA